MCQVIKILGKKISEQFAQVQKVSPPLLHKEAPRRCLPLPIAPAEAPPRWCVQAFRSLDADYSGCIGADEFRRLLTRCEMHAWCPPFGLARPPGALPSCAQPALLMGAL